VSFAKYSIAKSRATIIAMKDSKKDTYSFINKILTFGVLVLVIIGGITVTPERVFSSGFTHQGTPFGGPIMYSLECTCSGNTLLFVLDYLTSSAVLVLKDPSSVLYQYQQNFTIGNYVLGTYSPGPQCLLYTGNACVEIVSHGAINQGPGAGASGFGL